VYTVYALVGLAIFGLYTVIDFNRLRRAGTDEAIPLAAGIFLDVLNIFLLSCSCSRAPRVDANSAPLHSPNRSICRHRCHKATTPSADSRTFAARRR
jgi:hypothetical protein